MKPLARRIVDAPAFQHAITAVIMLAGVLVGIETDAQIVARYGAVLHVFDFAIVALCFVPMQGQYVTVLRLLRLLRVLRLLRALPRLQLLVSALLHSIPSMGYVAMFLGLLQECPRVLRHRFPDAGTLGPALVHRPRPDLTD